MKKGSILATLAFTSTVKGFQTPSFIHTRHSTIATTPDSSTSRIIQLSSKQPEYHANDEHVRGGGGGEEEESTMSRRTVFDNVYKSSIALTTTATAGICNHPFIVNAIDGTNEAEAVAATITKPTTATTAITTTTTTGIPTIPLGKSSLNVSRTIQGYWQLAGGHGKYNTEEAIKNMEAHYKAGITTLDTADIYGPSEQIMGKFLEKISTGSAATTAAAAPVPCTKFCCFRYLDEIDKDEVRSRIKKACERLRVEKIPLVQFFWSNYDIKRYVDVALMLTELKEEGLIGEIGATNFDLKRLMELKDAGVPLVSHQVQLSCLDQRPVQSGMADWCAENDVSLIAFGTVGSGILSEKYLGRGAPSQEEKNTSSMKMYSKTAERFGSWDLVQDLLKTMDVVANDVRSSGRCENANISNVAQRYVLDTKAVASVLIGVRNRNHIEENVRTHSFQLTDGERDAISAVIAKRKGPSGDVWDLERGNLPGKK